MENIKTFYEQAIECQKRFEQNINGNGREYVDTLFVRINDKDEILKSETPDILAEETKCCILVHQYREKPVYNWYSLYRIEFIDANHCVRTELLDERYKLQIKYKEHLNNQWLCFDADGKSIYSCKWPDEESQIKIVWALYQKCLSCETTKEAELLGELVKMEQSVLYLKRDLANKDYMAELLQKECDQYKSLLDEIKELVHKR